MCFEPVRPVLSVYAHAGRNAGVSRHRFVRTGRALFGLVQREQLPFLAAAIAYYAFASLVPLLVVALAAGTAVAGEQLTVRVLSAAGSVLTPEATGLVERALSGDQPGATAVGLGVLAWSGLRVFRGLDVAFARIYGAEQGKTLPAQLADAAATVGAILVAVAVTVLVGTAISAEFGTVSRLAGPIGVAVALPVVFFPLYYVLPDRSVSLTEALPGAVVAGLGWTALGVGFGAYASRASTFELYGVLGGVFLLLVWFYAGGLIVLLGAGLNAVTARDRQLQHEPPRDHRQRSMSEPADGTDSDRSDPDTGDRTAPENGADDQTASETHPGDPAGADRADAVTQDEIDRLRREIDELETELDRRTVGREKIESDLKRYVRRQVRRGHARGWGPYLVLGYGTAMTLGAFYFLGGGWAILAMLIVWLSTLGLYALMIAVGLTVSAAGAPGRLLDRLR